MKIKFWEKKVGRREGQKILDRKKVRESAKIFSGEKLERKKLERNKVGEVVSNFKERSKFPEIRVEMG